MRFERGLDTIGQGKAYRTRGEIMTENGNMKVKCHILFWGAAAVRTHTIMRQILDRQADDTVYKCYMLNWSYMLNWCRCRAGIYAELFK